MYDFKIQNRYVCHSSSVPARNDGRLDLHVRRFKGWFFTSANREEPDTFNNIIVQKIVKYKVHMTMMMMICLLVACMSTKMSILIWEGAFPLEVCTCD